MLNIKDTYATIWQPENKGKYTVANISTSKKDKDGNWINMSWKAKFVGKNQDVSEKQRIKITNAAIEQRKYQEKYYYDVIIFEFELLENKKEKSEMPTFTPVDKDDELPF